MEIPLLLNPENIFFDLYNLLWTMKSKESYFSFLIPDTILFIEDKPVIWFFNSKSGGIRRKLKDKLTNDHIIKKFTKKKSEIIGYYFYHKEKDISLIENFELKEQDSNYYLNKFVKEMDIEIPKQTHHHTENKKNLKFEFFESPNSLRNFLENFNKRMGVLQLFINSNQDPHTMFRILWTPKTKIYDMRRSRKHMNRSIHFYEKCVTYETEKFNIKTELIKSPLVKEKLEKATLEIVEQLEKLYKDTFSIKSIILHFKENMNEELYFTYCTGIFLVQYESHEKNNSIWKGLFFEADVSEKFYHNFSKYEYEKDYDLTPDYTCANCNKLTSHKQAKLIQYKCLIKSEKMLRIKKSSIEPSNNKEDILNIFRNKYNDPILIHHFDEKQFNDRQENKGDSFFPLKITLRRGNNSVVPHAIRNVEKNFTKERYDNLKNDVFFKDRMVKVCEDCYIELSRISFLTRDEYNSKLTTQIIKHKVNSDRIRIGELQNMQKKPQVISFKKKESFCIKTPLTNSMNNIRLQSAMVKGIQTNKTRNLSTTMESKNYLSSNSMKRSFSGKSLNKSRITNFTSMILKDEKSELRYSQATKPKILSDKKHIIEIRKKKTFSLFNK